MFYAWWKSPGIVFLETGLNILNCSRYFSNKSFHTIILNEQQHDNINDKACMLCRDADNNDHPRFYLSNSFQCPVEKLLNNQTAHWENTDHSWWASRLIAVFAERTYIHSRCLFCQADSKIKY